jgi:hypothetical protein
MAPHPAQPPTLAIHATAFPGRYDVRHRGTLVSIVDTSPENPAFGHSAESTAVRTAPSLAGLRTMEGPFTCKWSTRSTLLPSGSHRHSAGPGIPGQLDRPAGHPPDAPAKREPTPRPPRRRQPHGDTYGVAGQVEVTYTAHPQGCMTARPAEPPGRICCTRLLHNGHAPPTAAVCVACAVADRSVTGASTGWAADGDEGVDVMEMHGSDALRQRRRINVGHGRR